MTTPSTVKDLVRQVFDALDERDRAAFIDLHTADAELHTGGETIAGIDDLVAAEFAYFDVFPDLAMTIDALYAEGDTASARWTVRGTHEGEFKGIEPTGAVVEFATIGMFRIEDEKIAEVWLEGDHLGLLRQLGVELPGA